MTACRHSSGQRVSHYAEQQSHVSTVGGFRVRWDTLYCVQDYDYLCRCGATVLIGRRETAYLLCELFTKTAEGEEHEHQGDINDSGLAH
jgi:hypothetical protein